MDFKICVRYQKIPYKIHKRNPFRRDYPCEKSVQIFKKYLLLFLFFPHKTRWLSHSAIKHITFNIGYVRKKPTPKLKPIEIM